MDLDLKEKVALITGAGRGIGKACALGLADEGCSIAICGRGEEALNETAEELRGKDVAVLAVPSDVTRLADNKNFVAQAAEMFGRIDILVNNAGTGRLSDPMELPEEEFRYNLDLMLFGPVQMATLHPSSARASAQDLPIPRLAPVTNATLSFNASSIAILLSI